MIFGILIGIIVVLALLVMLLYNRLVRLSNQVKNAWAQIDVQLKKRNDLVPNLVEAVKGYMKHERELLENITKARASLTQARTPEKKAQASNALTDTLKTLFAVSENYPQLKANENFLQLQEELSGIENKIAYARQFYNDIVMTYNTSLEVVPTNIVAGVFNFGKEHLFSATDAERKNVKVSF